MKFTPPRSIFLLILILLLAVACRRIVNRQSGSNPPAGGQKITQPAQPSGMVPGGSGYTSANIVKHEYGSGVTAYWIFEPSGPAPASAPVIVFNHGWGGTDPGSYGAWVEHIVKRGNIVIYPEYQDGLTTPTSTFTDNAMVAIKAATQELNTGAGHVKPDWGKFAIVGHSVGGLLAANESALAQSQGLPKPLAVMSVEPGKTWTFSSRTSVPLVDLSGIPANSLLLAVVGDNDKLVKDVDGKKIFQQTPQIPLGNKDFVIIQSDDHGSPALDANHLAPTGQGSVIVKFSSGSGTSSRPILQMLLERRAQTKATSAESDQTAVTDPSLGSSTVDALDYYGYWKLFDGLTDAAFYGKNRDYALGNTQNQTFMGNWSDGTPVKPLLIITNP